MAEAISRRQALAGAGAAVGSAALLWPQGAQPQTPNLDAPANIRDAWLGGTLVRVDGPRTALVRLSRSTAEVRVELTDGARVLRDGPVDLNAFEPGDEVSADGEWSGEVYVATAFEVTYRVVEAQVLERHGQRLVTDRGDIVIDAATHARAGEAEGRRFVARSPDRLGRGDRIMVLGRRSPAGDGLIARDVGVVAQP